MYIIFSKFFSNANSTITASYYKLLRVVAASISTMTCNHNYIGQKNNLNNAIITFDRLSTTENKITFSVLKVDLSSNEVNYLLAEMSSSKVINAFNIRTDATVGTIQQFNLEYQVLRQ